MNNTSISRQENFLQSDFVQLETGNPLRDLLNSRWVFSAWLSAFHILTEENLENGFTAEELRTQTKLSPLFLEVFLDVLVESQLLQRPCHTYHCSPFARTLLKAGHNPAESFFAELQETFLQTEKIVSAARNHQITLASYYQNLSSYQKNNAFTWSFLYNPVWKLTIWLSFLEAIHFEDHLVNLGLEEAIKKELLFSPYAKEIKGILRQAELIEFLPGKKDFTLHPSLKEILKKVSAETLFALLRVTFAQTRAMFTAIETRQLTLGWSYQDPSILEAQGTVSKQCSQGFLEMPPADEKLSMPNTCFLDAGAGVGRLTMEMCRLYQHPQAVALEPFDTPYALAKTAIAKSPYRKRIELRQSYAQHLTDVEKFDVVAFPQVYFQEAHLRPALVAIMRAMKPGGVLATGGEDSIEEKSLFGAIQRLKNTLNGGSFRSGNDTTQLLYSVGFTDVITFPLIGGWHPITAIKPF